MLFAYIRPRRSRPSYQVPADASAQTSNGMSAREEKNLPAKADVPMLLGAMALTYSI